MCRNICGYIRGSYIYLLFITSRDVSWAIDRWMSPVNGYSSDCSHVWFDNLQVRPTWYTWRVMSILTPTSRFPAFLIDRHICHCITTTCAVLTRALTGARHSPGLQQMAARRVESQWRRSEIAHRTYLSFQQRVWSTSRLLRYQQYSHRIAWPLRWASCVAQLLAKVRLYDGNHTDCGQLVCVNRKYDIYLARVDHGDGVSTAPRCVWSAARCDVLIVSGRSSMANFQISDQIP
jgi:hypothetical protein